MQSNQAKHQGLQILDKVVEDTKSLWISGFGYIDQRSNLGGLDSC